MNLTIKQLQGKLDGLWQHGKVLPRKDVNFFQGSGGRRTAAWSASLNYQCLDTYGPNQRVKLLGVVLTAWNRNQSQSVQRVLKPGADLKLAIQKLVLKAQELCTHRYYVELSPTEAAQHGVQHFGNCWHVYLCHDCGEVFSQDTSG